MDGGGLGGRSTILLLDRPEMFVSKRGAPIASHHARLNLTLHAHDDYRSLVPQAPSVPEAANGRVGSMSHRVQACNATFICGVAQPSMLAGYA